MYERFEELLKKHKITRYAVAKATGVAQSVLSRWALKGALPSYENLIKIADYFGVSVDYLLGRTDDPKMSSRQTIDGALQEVRDAEDELDDLAQFLLENPDMPVNFSGTHMDAETRRLLAIALRHAKELVEEKQKGQEEE